MLPIFRLFNKYLRIYYVLGPLLVQDIQQWTESYWIKGTDRIINKYLCSRWAQIQFYVSWLGKASPLRGWRRECQMDLWPREEGMQRPWGLVDFRKSQKSSGTTVEKGRCAEVPWTKKALWLSFSVRGEEMGIFSRETCLYSHFKASLQSLCNKDGSRGPRRDLVNNPVQGDASVDEGVWWLRW